MADKPLDKMLVEAAQGYRQFWDQHPVLGFGLGFAPFVGQALGLADAAAAAIDPTAGKGETALATAGILPLGKLYSGTRRIIAGQTAKTIDPVKAEAMMQELMDSGDDLKKLTAKQKDYYAQKYGMWPEPQVFGGHSPGFEIPDSFAQFSPRGEQVMRSLQERSATGTKFTVAGKFKDYVDHPALTRAYPEFNDVNVVFSNELPDGVKAQFSPSKNRILLGPNATLPDMLHEMQHKVQSIEDWDGGFGFWKAWRDEAIKEGLSKEQADMLWRAMWRKNYGENQAEVVAERYIKAKRQSPDSPLGMDQVYKRERPTEHVGNYSLDEPKRLIGGGDERMLFNSGVRAIKGEPPRMVDPEQVMPTPPDPDQELYDRMLQKFLKEAQAKKEAGFGAVTKPTSYE